MVIMKLEICCIQWDEQKYFATLLILSAITVVNRENFFFHVNIYNYLFFVYLGVLEDTFVVIQNIDMEKEENLRFTVVTHHSNLHGRALLVC